MLANECDESAGRPGQPTPIARTPTRLSADLATLRNRPAELKWAERCKI